MEKPSGGRVFRDVPMSRVILVVPLLVLGSFAVVHRLAPTPGDPCACPSDILLGAATQGSCDGATA